MAAAGGAAAVVLDIGTGTGLLAMLAAKAGAGAVVACETFEPMVTVHASELRATVFVRQSLYSVCSFVRQCGARHQAKCY